MMASGLFNSQTALLDTYFLDNVNQRIFWNKKKASSGHTKNSGKLNWESSSAAASFAAPGSDSVNGIQFIVLSNGGSKRGAPKGNSYVAFALKQYG